MHIFICMERKCNSADAVAKKKKLWMLTKCFSAISFLFLNFAVSVLRNSLQVEIEIQYSLDCNDWGFSWNETRHSTV